MLLVLENRLDRLSEQAGNPEGERQAWVVLAGLDRVNALAGNVEALGQVGLVPSEFCAQRLESVLHGPDR